MDVYGFSSMEKEQNQATYAIADFMKSLNIKEYCYLENVYRCWNYEWEAEKRKSNYWTYDNMFSCIMGIRDEERKRAVLIPGCMSSDGHLRQKCLKELANYKNSLPFLLLRLNDWVKEIRVDAFEFSVQRMQRADVEELLLALPVIEKIRNSNRKNNEDFAVITNAFYLCVVENVRKMNLSEINQFDQTVRNAFYRLINHFDIYEKSRLMDLLKITKGSYESRMVIHALLQYYDITEQDFLYYLKNSNGIIRRCAIEKWTEKHGIWDGAEQYLLDSAKSVRLNVQYWVRKYTDINIVDFYIAQLDHEKFKIVIDGLGETADRRRRRILSAVLAF